MLKTAQWQLAWQTLKYEKKFRFWHFKKNLLIKDAPKHVSTVWVFDTRISHKPFLLSKNNVSMWISSYSFVQNDIFPKVAHVLWLWEFVNMCLIHLETRIWSYVIHVYSKKWFFGPPKRCCTPWAEGIIFFSTLNFIILQMVRNECVKFDGHIDTQISCKILWLKIPILILYNPPYFQEGLFWGNFGVNATIDVWSGLIKTGTLQFLQVVKR